MMIQPIPSRNPINQFLDLPYRDGVRYLKGAFAPTHLLAREQDNPSTAKILLTRAVRVLTGLVLLIPLLNIIADILLRKLLMNPQPQPTNNDAINDTAVESSIQTVQDVEKLANNIITDLQSYAPSVTITYTIQDSFTRLLSTDDKVQTKDIVFDLKFADGRTVIDRVSIRMSKNHDADFNRRYHRERLKFEIFNQVQSQKSSRDLFKELFEGSDEWTPMHLEKDPTFKFLRDGVDKWSEETGFKMLIKDPKLIKKTYKWGDHYGLTFEVSKDNGNSYHKVELSVHVNDHTKGTFAQSRQAFIEEFITDAWKELYPR